MNKAFLIGRLTKDPDLKYSSSNVAIVRFSIAIDRQYTNQQGKKDTDFISIVAFQKQAENINRYIHKGSQVAVDGRIQSRSYDDKDGKKVYVTEVVADRVQFLDSKNSNKDNSEGVTPSDFDNKETETVNVSDDIYESFGNESIEVSDDDIAF